jgi:hypothetical protein
MLSAVAGAGRAPTPRERHCDGDTGLLNIRAAWHRPRQLGPATGVCIRTAHQAVRILIWRAWRVRARARRRHRVVIAASSGGSACPAPKQQ